jgi:hypothetical protein
MKDPRTKTKPVITVPVNDICHVCNQSAAVIPVERLSKNGIVMKATHSDANRTTIAGQNTNHSGTWDSVSPEIQLG